MLGNDVWHQMYDVISANFECNVRADKKSAEMLADILNKQVVFDTNSILHTLIKDRDVFVVGSGPSLHDSFDTIEHYAKNVVVIASDTSLKPLLEHKIIPNVVVTDLDGDMASHTKASEYGAIMVVHAHADNTHMLHYAKQYKRCIGTTQTAPVRHIQNFGGFTDGDRAIFLATHFMPRCIVLFGMDFGFKVGQYSNTTKSDYATKVQKMKIGKELLERWIVNDSSLACRIYAISGDDGDGDSVIEGVESIAYGSIDSILDKTTIVNN